MTMDYCIGLPPGCPDHESAPREYQCAKCGPFEAMPNDDRTCPECGNHPAGCDCEDCRVPALKGAGAEKSSVVANENSIYRESTNVPVGRRVQGIMALLGRAA